MFRDDRDVFVAANLMWYAIEDEPDEVAAPDVMVAFGRPKGDRGSYKQWEENDVPVTVAFEILSPSTDRDEMADKLLFYEHHGVEEYYVYDPDRNTLEVYTRSKTTLRRHRNIATFASPRLGIRFEMTAPEMTVYGPDGRRFIPFDELRRNADDAAKLAGAAAKQADDAAKRADDADRLNVRLKELGRKVRRGQATPEEVAELDRLEDETA